MQVREANADDIPAIVTIYNQGIMDRQATFETRARSEQDIQGWLGNAARYPVLVGVDEQGQVMGWASTSAYRERECYAGIAEFSVYVARDSRSRGVGKQLLTSLVSAAKDKGFWKLLSRVFTFNHGSLAMCRTCGFREVGIYEKHAQLEGKWLDVVIVEHLINENQPFASFQGEKA